MTFHEGFQTHFRLSSGKQIGPAEPCYIIAEIGSNHDNSLEKAKRLMLSAKEAGADAAKFQSFQVENLINGMRKNESGQWEGHPAWDILEKLSLPDDWHQALSDYGREIGIDWFSAPFDANRVDLLEQVQVPIYKIASGDLTHHLLLKKVAATGKPVILSTGMATLAEVSDAMAVLQASGCSQVALLHCVSLYPPQFQDANIKAMVTLRQEFGCPVGFSDHLPGSVIPLGAVALGANIIEKHLTDDRSLPGPDHPYALDIPAFTSMVREIRQLEAALGTGQKEPVPGEVPERVGARRAVYASADLKIGTTLTAENTKIVRHAYPEGIPAESAEIAFGRPLNQDVTQGQIIGWSHLD